MNIPTPPVNRPAFPNTASTGDPRDGVYSTDGMGQREYFAIHAPAAEIDTMVGPSSADAAKFIGIEVAEYHPQKHYLQVCVKARAMFADALLAELQKGAQP